MPAPTKVIQRTRTLPSVVETYKATRPQLIGDAERQEGELVPEAYDWPLLESVIRSGYLRECTVSGETFVEAVKEFCPELADELGAKYGIDPATLKGE